MSVYPDNRTQAIMMKILLLGESNVGKTSLVTRYVNDKFDAQSNLLTIGIDTRKLNRVCRNKQILLELWDTAGQERYKTIPAQYFKGVQGVILVYDITDGESFVRIQDWLEKLQQNVSLNDLSVLLVGNKLDLAFRRQVKESDSQSFANSKGMQILQTSAKESTNVDRMIEHMMQSILDKGIKCSHRTVKLDEPMKRKKKQQEQTSCCG